ncbi:MAG TPA: 16S rRNA (adenine(1518)-N(6)/adenine(1519)-N(6))-dimethyltransferase RsmA [Pirellulales bacterium]|nr:16S rRNA (adenine(1518)-N(6)/adenine(1519)-N(6))-dimethyltransferase RsmA [Pirellulales bacterium]
MPTPASGNQTISYLSRRFIEAGIRLNPRHGQNFLIDLNLMRLIVERAELSPSDVVLEVGTGTGALTALMAEHVAAVVTVEIDPQLYQLASEELFGFSNVVMLAQDALKNKSTFDPRLIAALEEQLAGGPDRHLKLVANLPFCVATPVIANLLLSAVTPESMTVTIQKELADRITAKPGTKDYGALGVWIQSQCRTELVRNLPPTVFWPRPKVHSAIIHIAVDQQMRRQLPDGAFFHDFVRSLFFHRRKFLRSVLQSALKGRLDKSAIDELLADTGLSPVCRAEQLDVAAILALAEAVRARLGPKMSN